jgi:hypothetical protein
MWYHRLDLVPRTQRHEEGPVYVARYENYYSFTFFPTWKELYNFISSEGIGRMSLYEVIPDEWQKLHFDLDIIDGVCHQDVLEETVSGIELSFQQLYHQPLNLTHDLLVYESHGNGKYSYHIVIDNYSVSGKKQAKAFYHNVIANMTNYTKYVDSAVYKSNQQFRLLGCCKHNTDRVKKFVPTWNYKSNIITYNGSEDSALRFRSSLVSLTSYTRRLPNIDVEPDYSLDDEYLSLPEVKMVLRLCAQHINPFPFVLREVKGKIIVLKRISPSFCNICRRVHQHENPFVLVRNDSVVFYCRRNSVGIEIRDDRMFSVPHTSFEI